MKLPEVCEDEWIAAALRGEPPTFDGLDDKRSLDLVKAAAQHGVAPLLHRTLYESPAWARCPEPLREALARAARQATALDMLREHDLGLLLDRLDGADIRFLLIKGGGLAHTHYEASYLRDRCDTDILFPDGAVFDRAWALLESLGYRRRNTLSGEFVGYQHCCWKPLGPEAHQVLDCHIRINDYLFFADAFGFDELMERSVGIPVLARSARTLGPVHALLMACIHRVATIPLGDADRLIWLFDMHLLAKSFAEDEWALFLELARERGIAGSCLHSLAAARRYFPVPAPAAVMEGLKQAAARESFKPGEEMSRWRYYSHVFRSVPGVGGKARLLREHFLPAPEYLLEKYQTTNRLALPWLYVHRVFSGMRRYF